jgi:hypothetical protein
MSETDPEVTSDAQDKPVEFFPEGFSYENGTTDETELEPDEPPKSGEWVDVHDVLSSLTEDEREQGLAMGESIDPEDDTDNGLSEKES